MNLTKKFLLSRNTTPKSGVFLTGNNYTPAYTCTGFTFSTDGKWFITVNSTNARIEIYPLGTAFDLSTIGTSTTFSRANILNGSWVAVNPTGTVLYFFSNAGNDFVAQYALSTPYDATTATLTATQTISTMAGYSNMYGMFINSTGTKLFTGGIDGNVREFTFGTPYMVSTLSYVGATSLSAIRGVFFSPNGVYVYTLKITPARTIERRTLSTPFDLSTAGSVDGSYTQGSALVCFFITRNGRKIYVAGSTTPIREATIYPPFKLP